MKNQQSNKRQSKSGQRRKGPSTGKKPYSKRRKPTGASRLTNMDTVFRRFDHLRETHNHARRKYFEMYHRIDDAKREKLKSKYEHALKELHQFVNKLSDYQKKRFEERFNSKADTTYSQARELEAEGELSGNVSEIDVHILPSQDSRPSYEGDEEESVGTMEDYEKYQIEKGV